MKVVSVALYFGHFNRLRNYKPLYAPEYVSGSVFPDAGVQSVIKKCSHVYLKRQRHAAMETPIIIIP